MPLFRILFEKLVLGDAIDCLSKASQEIIKSRRDHDSENNTVRDTYTRNCYKLLL